LLQVFRVSRPVQRDLRGCRFLPFGERSQPIDERQIRFSILRREARDDVAEIRAVASGALVRVLEDWCPPSAGYFP